MEGVSIKSPGLNIRKNNKHILDSCINIKQTYSFHKKTLPHYGGATRDILWGVQDSLQIFQLCTQVPILKTCIKTGGPRMVGKVFGDMEKVDTPKRIRYGLWMDFFN